jgi:hypothetical protein
MDASLLQALSAADDPEHWDCPPDFPWELAVAEVAALQPQLEDAIGHSLVLDKNVQDAAHFTELSWQTEPRPVPGVGERVILTRIAIRFSAFGRLATIWENAPEAPLDADLIDRLIHILANAGFKVVPVDTLDEPTVGEIGSPLQFTRGG